MGATAMRREERNFIYAPEMVDVDAFACHWMITLNKCSQDGLYLPAMSRLVNERDSVRDELSEYWGLSESESKAMINAMLFGKDIVQEGFGDRIHHVIIEVEEEIKRLNHHIRMVCIACVIGPALLLL